MSATEHTAIPRSLQHEGGRPMIDFGVTPEQFRERYLERAPLLQRRALQAPHFDWRDLDDVLHVAEPTAPGFQLFRNGLLSDELFTDRAVEFGVPRRRLNKRRFYEQLRGGATLVMNRFESYSPAALQIVSTVGRFTGWPALGNAYLSFGGRGSFGRHWDTHDVFAIQLFGRKRWRLYAPTFALPLAMHRSDASGQQCPAGPLLDCVLETGDLLYVPRGWWHEALPFDEPSLHLSVGTYAPTAHDYVLWAAARHLPAAESARRALTANVGPAELAAALADLARIVQDAARRAEFEREVAVRARVSSGFDTELHLGMRTAALEGATVTLARPRVAESDAGSNGAHPASAAARAIIAALESGPSTVEALYGCVEGATHADVRAVLLELAQNDVVSIVRRAPPLR